MGKGRRPALDVPDSWERHLYVAAFVVAMAKLFADITSHIGLGLPVAYVVGSIVVIALVASPQRGLLALGAALVAFGDVNPLWTQVKSPWEVGVLTEWVNLNNAFIGPFAIVNYLLAAVAVMIAVRAMVHGGVRVPLIARGGLALLAVIGGLGLSNLGTAEAVRRYISDIGPLLALSVMAIAGANVFRKAQGHKATALLIGMVIAHPIENLIINLLRTMGVGILSAGSTFGFAGILASMMFVMIQPPTTWIGRIGLILALTGSALGVLEGFGSASLVYTAVGLMAGAAVAVRARLTTWGRVLAFPVMLLLVFSTGFLWQGGSSSRLMHKVDNLASMVRAVKTGTDALNPTVYVRLAELVNIVSTARAVSVVAGRGAGGYFVYDVMEPQEIYTTPGSYSADQLSSGRFYTPHDFINWLLLKGGVIGLALYVSLFVRLWRRLVFLSVDRACRQRRVWAVVMAAMLPGIMYHGTWGNAAPMFSGLLLGALDAAQCKDIEWERTRA